jgi:hypothetical protein
MPIATGSSYGAQGRNRTTDTCIFSAVLYRLSYLGARRTSGMLLTGARYRGSCFHCPESEGAPVLVRPLIALIAPSILFRSFCRRHHVSA